MKNFWNKIINHGVNPDYLDWDNRNLRFMNAMAFIMCCSMFMFLTLALGLKIYIDIPLIGIALLLSGSHFLVAWKTNMTFTKVYFSMMPIIMVAMFSVLAVGGVGNDKMYIFSSSIVPMVLFREKKFYITLVLINVFTFFFIGFLQKHIPPLTVMTPNELELYRSVNMLMVFVFIFSLLHLFKFEIFSYQKEIEEQKEIIQEKNKEVTESIEYAKSIQEAILPPRHYFQLYLRDSFIWYKPKDIVAGDFYWMEKRNGMLYFAVADCTGHGVPGAMVSVVCHNALYRCVQEFKLEHPNEILDKTRELVVETFSKSDRDVKDGMDIALCLYDISEHKLEFAGANNSLYMLREGEIQEIKPDKEPVGLYESPTPFTNHVLQMQKGDLIYLFTDGFADQFGGIKGKKYKYKPFREFLTKLQSTPIEDQKELIDKEFENWRGDYEQIDDVCVMGVKF